ncbi:MAG: pyruvate kinase [Betaproteobacteria bacterium]|nr:MAG: pyruvate kinase [Betaproteobacteria bacterium]
MRRHRNAKIVATLGPASASEAMIRSLFLAGVDVFRLNFSHGTHEQHRERLQQIRNVERDVGRPIGVLADMQGPKLRVGTFANGPVTLVAGSPFRLDLTDKPGDATRAYLPHPEIFAALKPGSNLLLDDGKLRLRVTRCTAEFAETEVIVGGPLSERKGVNVPDAVLPVSALTEKDRRDLEFALELGVEWLALSFVQRPEDLDEARALAKGRARIMTKLEKPSAVERLDDIVEKSDAIMVARGDLGVELPAEKVPAIQRRVVRACRRQGKPVIVATQMLESMISSPVPTRAEASDVATAIYHGADAVMLSAESASGKYPLQAVQMMERILAEVESDPYHRQLLKASQTRAQATSADAICAAMDTIAGLLPVAVIVTYTTSGSTSLRAARERPIPPILSMTPTLATARCLALVWGVHSVQTPDVSDVAEMVEHACQRAVAEEFAKPGDTILISAGMPFGTPGATNLLRIAAV